MSARIKHLIAVALLGVLGTLSLAVASGVLKLTLPVLFNGVGVSVLQSFSVEILLTAPTENAQAMVEDDLANIRSVKNVRSAAVTDEHPLGGSGREVVFGRDPFLNVVSASAGLVSAGHGFLDAAGVRVISGRDLTFDDTRWITSNSETDGTPVVVSKKMAESLFGSEDPIGQYIYLTSDRSSREIVGVVEKLIHGQHHAKSAPLTVVQPTMRPDAQRYVYLINVQDRRKIADTIAEVEKSLRSSALPRIVRNSDTMKSRYLRAFAGELISVVSAFAIILSVAIILGLISYFLTWRDFDSQRNNLVVKVSLGAGPISILLIMIMSYTLAILVGIGVGCFIIQAKLGPILSDAATQDVVQNADMIIAGIVMLGLVSVGQLVFVVREKALRHDQLFGEVADAR